MDGMRLLILGGTRFVGHAVAAAALREGWEVTTFNRGLSGADLAGVNTIRGDPMLAADVTRLAAVGPNAGWQATRRGRR
jgi:nucleoside-diphosphate-sugar epimerase